jgi:replicative DNA helicase
VRLLDYASRFLTTDHFEDRTQKVLFHLAREYADQTRGLLPRHALEDVLRSKPAGTALQYAEYYDMLAALRPSASDFRHSVAQVRELRQDRLTGEALLQSMEILRNGATEAGKEVRGHVDARRHAMAAFALIEREASASSSPEGDIRRETARMHEEYARTRERRLSGGTPGIATGISRLDEALSGGLGNGEFALIAGFSSCGKSQWCAHQAWHASVMQGRNVVLFSSETTRANMQVRILGRHSRMEQFGLQAGLNTSHIRAGTLTGEEYQAFRAVLADFGSGQYGKCYIVQLPKGSTMSVVESRLAAISRQFTPDIAIIDYLALLRPEQRSRDRERRDELAVLLQDAKQLAVTFAEGRGLPVMSPWQISRSGRKDVVSRGYYTMSDLAETAEAERTPDVIISLLDPEHDDTRGRKVPLKLDVMKNRENERFVHMDLLADFANSHFVLADSAEGGSLLGSLMEGED